MVGRPKGERHNEEFRRLVEASGLSRERVSELIGVSLSTVNSWMSKEWARDSYPCRKYRVDAFKEILERLT
jgi:transcriptional regulator with XRE-family HTH domain